MGFSVISGDQFGVVVRSDNASFDGTKRGGVMSTNGQLWIGSGVSPRVKVGTLISPLGTITIGYSSPNITLDITGGSTGIQQVTVDAGQTIVPSGSPANITITGNTVANATNSKPIFVIKNSANSAAIDVQVASAIAATNINNTGLAAFNSAQFSVDANGFVSTAGIPANAITKVVVQTFTSTGTYTPTAGMKYVTLEVVGGGGGGGGTASSTSTQVAAAAGGGGGGYSRKTVTAATIGASQSVTVGTGGSGGASGSNNGSPGNTSSVGAILSATGGAGGGASLAGNIASTIGGVGGVGSSGDINSTGTVGNPSYAVYLAVFTSGNLIGGGGGSSYFGGGALAHATFSGAIDGVNGNAYGGGGGGGVSGNGGTSAGGNGSNGIVICTEYVSS